MRRASDFDKYLALYAHGAYRDAYAALRDILKNNQRWATMGDLYVWCADLEMLANDDPRKARQQLDKARTLGCLDEAAYHRTNGFVLWCTGERERGIAEIERSVELKPSVRHLSTLGKVLSTDGDPRASGIWRRVLQQEPDN